MLRIRTGTAPAILLAIIVIDCLAGIISTVAYATNIQRIKRLESMLSGLHQCETPSQRGDRTIIVVRNDGLRLVVTCQPLPNWRSPERIKP